MFEICSKITKTQKQCQHRRSGAFIVNYKRISCMSCEFIIEFEQVNAVG